MFVSGGIDTWEFDVLECDGTVDLNSEEIYAQLSEWTDWDGPPVNFRCRCPFGCELDEHGFLAGCADEFSPCGGSNECCGQYDGDVCFNGNGILIIQVQNKYFRTFSNATIRRNFITKIKGCSPNIRPLLSFLTN